MGIENIVFVVFSNYCQIFDICLFLCSWKSVCGAKHSFSSQIHALLLLFSAVQIELFTVCFFTHWHCLRVDTVIGSFFFYKRFDSNTENCSKCLYCPHCIHSPCMTVMLCFWYFSFSWICIYYWFSLKCFFSRWKFINHVWLLVHLFYLP